MLNTIVSLACFLCGRSTELPTTLLVDGVQVGRVLVGRVFLDQMRICDDFRISAHARHTLFLGDVVEALDLFLFFDVIANMRHDMPYTAQMGTNQDGHAMSTPAAAYARTAS